MRRRPPTRGSGAKAWLTISASPEGISLMLISRMMTAPTT